MYNLFISILIFIYNFCSILWWINLVSPGPPFFFFLHKHYLMVNNLLNNNWLFTYNLTVTLICLTLSSKQILHTFLIILKLAPSKTRGRSYKNSSTGKLPARYLSHYSFDYKLYLLPKFTHFTLSNIQWMHYNLIEHIVG